MSLQCAFGPFADLHRQSRLVAIKVARADSRQVRKELRMYRSLAESGVDEHVVMPVNTFVEVGPNGEHQCLVFEPMGPSASDVLQVFPDT